MFTQSPLFKAIVLTLVISMALSACNFPGFAGQEEEDISDIEATATSLAQTVEAIGTATLTPGDTALPPLPPSPSATLPIVTQPLLATTAAIPATTQAVPGAPTIWADTNTNCRLGPSKLYPIIDYLTTSQRSTVYGRNDNSANPWWYIAAPKKPGAFCWVWGSTTHVEGDINSLPIITPPPPPSPTNTSGPGLQVWFSNVHYCGLIPVAIFQVVNDSGATLRSMIMTLTDQTTSVTLYGPDIANSPFMSGSGNCPPGSNNLPSGSSGYIGGPLGVAIPGHVIRANIQLCTEPGGASCSSFSVQFTIP